MTLGVSVLLEVTIWELLWLPVGERVVVSVGEADGVALSDVVCVGVPTWEPVPVPDCEGVKVFEFVIEGVVVDEGELVGGTGTLMARILLFIVSPCHANCNDR